MRGGAAAALQEAHERLLFARAFPGSAAARHRAERALARFAARGGVRRFKDDLENTGIAGTRYRYPFNYSIARWLSARYGRGGRVDIDWAAYKKHEWDEVAALFSNVVAWAENEGLDDDDIGSWDWIRLARGKASSVVRRPPSEGTRSGPSDLSWLLERLAQGKYPEPLARHLYESLNLPLVWDLSGCRDAVTHAVLPVGRIYYAPVRRERPADFAAALREPLGALELLAGRRAQLYIDAARAALSQREREFHVIVHANPAEVYRVACGRGLEIVVFGLARPERLTLEADYGALLVRNGVPIGYGYAVIAFDRGDIAINIFPEYRAGESPYVFTKFAALFARYFGVRKIVMRRYQLGWQNPEGIEAGSFWFYYKLGFRSVDARVRTLADGEAQRLARRKGARSGEAMLRRLARSDMVLCLDGSAVERFRDVPLKEIGLKVTRLIERGYGGDRRRAVADCERRVGHLLGGSVAGCRLAPVIALIPHLTRWSRVERAALRRLVRLKEGRAERPFVLALRGASRLAQVLDRITRAPA
jgi:hypothetical protein